MKEGEKRYYIYKHTRLDTNEVFYIGRGKIYKRQIDSPTFTHRHSRAFDNSHRTDYWKRIIACTEYKVEVILYTDTFEEIKIKEAEFIKLYGRKNLGLGTLINFTNGGDGVEGYIWTDKQREKHSKWNKERIAKGFVPKNLFKKGTKPKNSIQVINKVTGIIYASITEAARQEGINPRNLRKKIQGKVNNNTNIIKYNNGM